MTTDLLIVNYNTRHLLQRLLDTLHSDYEEGAWKIYLADNNSTDDSQQWILDRIDRYQVEEVFFNENIGYSAAINQMAAVSNSEFLCAVNADTWFTTKHVKQVQRSFMELPNAGVIGVKQLDENGAVRHGGIFWDGATNPAHRGWSFVDKSDAYFKDRVPCWTVSGSIYYMRRSAWDEVGNCKPFKDLFPDLQGSWLPTPMYFEETFFSQMMHHMGREVWYDGTVDTAGHTWNASTGSHDNRLHQLFQESRELYIKTCDNLGIHHECH